MAWAKTNPDSRLATFVALQVAALPAWKTWALGIVPKLRQS